VCLPTKDTKHTKGNSVFIAFRFRRVRARSFRVFRVFRGPKVLILSRLRRVGALEAGLTALPTIGCTPQTFAVTESADHSAPGPLTVAKAMGCPANKVAWAGTCERKRENGANSGEPSTPMEKLVRVAGLEPAHLAALPPQSSVSANSTIRATGRLMNQFRRDCASAFSANCAFMGPSTARESPRIAAHCPKWSAEHCSGADGGFPPS
jgi:hypothetical protein